MIESIHFRNFKVLRDCTLPLSACTILIGPNGSGKSTVLQALELVRAQRQLGDQEWSAGTSTTDVGVEIAAAFTDPVPGHVMRLRWHHGGDMNLGYVLPDGVDQADPSPLRAFAAGIRVFSLDPDAIARPATIQKNVELGRDGSGLAALLDSLNDQHPERFAAVNVELSQWLPEFDRVQFERPAPGQKSLALRTRDGGHRIPAFQLSQGTLVALALLTLAHLPQPPTLIGIEELDRGIHPRLMRNVRDAIYRLAYPESCGEDREPVQILATTHSPYLLDLFKDYPENVVVADRLGNNVRFRRLSDQPAIQEMLGDASLGEAWFTGVLGGVPGQL